MTFKDLKEMVAAVEGSIDDDAVIYSKEVSSDGDISDRAVKTCFYFEQEYIDEKGKVSDDGNKVLFLWGVYS